MGVIWIDVWTILDQPDMASSIHKPQAIVLMHCKTCLALFFIMTDGAPLCRTGQQIQDNDPSVRLVNVVYCIWMCLASFGLSTRTYVI